MREDLLELRDRLANTLMLLETALHLPLGPDPKFLALLAEHCRTTGHEALAAAHALLTDAALEEATDC